MYLSPSELGVTSVDGGWPRAKRLFWLESEPGMEPGVRCEPMDVSHAVDRLSMVHAAHNLLYGDLGAFLDLARGGSTEARDGPTWRQLVERGLDGVASYRLSFPPGDRVLSQALEHLLQPV